MSKITVCGGRVKYPEREFATAIMPEDSIPFKNAAIGITYPTKDYVIKRELSEVTVFEYVLGGEGELFINGEWKKVKAGEVYILKEGEPHHYRTSARNPWKKIWINYESSYMAKMLASYKIESGVYSAEGVRARFEALLECSRNAIVSQRLCFIIADSLHAIINEIALERVNEKNDGRMIKESVEECVYKKLSLDALSERLNMSKSNIIRVFKKEYGVTPYEYLLSRKISAAKLLLENTSMTVKQIADRICINDEHYFSSLFLARVGMRPRDYRNKKNETH